MAAGHSIDDYLETIYFLAFPIGEYHPDTKGSPTLAVRVADMLGVSRASAGEMLKRLEAEGLVERGEHKEAILTAEGRAQAERVVRRHRIIERLLTDFMGYTPAEAHEQADLLGNTFTDEMVERIETQLGKPDRCPHGWPVDTDFEQAENRELQPLSDLAAGSEAEIVRLAEHDGDLLHWYYDEGLVPGTHIEVREADGGELTLSVGGDERPLDEKQAGGSVRSGPLARFVLEDDVHRREPERAQEARKHQARVLTGARDQAGALLCRCVHLLHREDVQLLLVVVVRGEDVADLVQRALVLVVDVAPRRVDARL